MNANANAMDGAREPGGSATLGDRLGPGLFFCGIAALWAYACVVLPIGRVLGAARTLASPAMFFLGLAVTAIASRARVARAWISTVRMLEIGVLSLTFVCLLVASDIVATLRENWTRSSADDLTAPEFRNRDRTVWHGELYPRTYIPPGQSFVLYKPNVRLTGDTYGERYVSAMLRSPTLRGSVLERRHISYFIGPEGLRELEPLADSHIFALGDSFAFGFATDEGKIWPDVLGASLHEPVYNLGVSATGPRPQLELLKYMMRTYPETMHVRTLLWMIFEGNDLENSYAVTPLDAAPLSTPSLFEGTVFEPLAELPSRIRSESVIGKLWRGDLTFGGGAQQSGTYNVDGVPIPVPMFHSARFGNRLFVPADMEAATRSRDYVLGHANRPRLDQTFREMRDLSRRSGFDVFVIVAPSDARLYGAAFEGFPRLSPEPYFVDYVTHLASDMGFSVLNLLPLLQPIAQNELLYYRDDHHWNVRGNEVVAGLVAHAFAPGDGAH